MAKKAMDLNITCGRCRGSSFIAEPYGAGQSYTLRCPKCRDNSGRYAYVKNVSSAVVDALIGMGHIVDAPVANFAQQTLSDMQDMGYPEPPPANAYDRYGSEAIPPAYAGTASTKSGNSQYSTSAIPPAFSSNHGRTLGTSDEYDAPNTHLGSVGSPESYGRQMNPAQEAPPTYTPSPSDPTIPPPYIPNSSGATPPPPFIPSSEQPAKPPAAKLETCPACSKNLPVKVSGTRYVVRMNKDRLVYSDELTGSILLTQNVSYCPFCGKKVSV